MFQFLYSTDSLGSQRLPIVQVHLSDDNGQRTAVSYFCKSNYSIGAAD